jgi:hypothetical protein
MAHKYVPILKSKPAEIWAWQNASANVLAASRVLFELVPTNTKTSPVTNFAKRLASNYPSGQIITADCDTFGQRSSAVTQLSQELYQRNIYERPVFRLSDTPAILRQIQQACVVHGQGACLRLGTDTQDPDPNVPVQHVTNIMSHLGLNISQIDLIIDFKAVDSSRNVNRCVPVALNMLNWATKCGAWRSVTLASGAFPKSVSNLTLGQATQLDRFDAMLFNRVVQGNPAITADFGDYGINYPIYGVPPPRAPNPNLRYTDGLQWQVEREQKTLLGNQAFFTLCRRVVRAPYFMGRRYSAGDAEIERCSHSVGSPGSATSWLSFGGSHHMAHVVDRLASLAVP